MAHLLWNSDGDAGKLVDEWMEGVYGPRAAKPEAIEVGAASVLLAREGLRFQSAAEHLFIVGWKPHARYDVEVDDEELREVETDAAGTMQLDFPEGRDAGVRINLRANPSSQEARSGSK